MIVTVVFDDHVSYYKIKQINLPGLGMAPHDERVDYLQVNGEPLAVANDSESELTLVVDESFHDEGDFQEAIADILAFRTED